VPLVGESRDGLLAEAGACEANRNLPALMLRTHTSTPMELRKAFRGDNRAAAEGSWERSVGVIVNFDHPHFYVYKMGFYEQKQSL
jgi:hypothetical protein